MSKIPVYFIPGMASNPLIFEHIKLDPTKYESHFLTWPQVHKTMSLDKYVDLFEKQINKSTPVLIGVSFGGIIAQELAKKIKVETIIIISSVKNTSEYPYLYKFARQTKLYKLLPTSLASKILGAYTRWLGNKNAKRKILYERYLTILDPLYLDWSIDKIINWQQIQTLENIIHIHGEKDELFPIKNIKNAIILPGGTHAMILTKYKWLNKNIPLLISNKKDETKY
ncbi:alpha/beta hydrolase family protein [Myroides sp. LJL115]